MESNGEGLYLQPFRLELATTLVVRMWLRVATFSLDYD